MTPKTVLITGASTGLGLSIAQEILNNTNDKVILTARVDSLKRFAEVGIKPSDRVILRALDICDYEQIKTVAFELNRECGGVDVLINNAGISYRSVVEHMTPDDEGQQMRVNYLGAFHLTRQLIPKMRENRRGHIINISSVGGMMAMPTMASYSASKFALEGASEALWYEMKPWNVHVTLVQIGFIHSNSFKNVIMTERARRSLQDPDDAYHMYYASMGPFVENLMERTLSNPEDIARKIVKLMHKANPPLRMSGTLDATLFVLLRRFVPRFLYHLILNYNLPKIRMWGPRDK